jgi:hypothetical protein
MDSLYKILDDLQSDNEISINEFIKNFISYIKNNLNDQSFIMYISNHIESCKNTTDDYASLSCIHINKLRYYIGSGSKNLIYYYGQDMDLTNDEWYNILEFLSKESIINLFIE